MLSDFLEHDIVEVEVSLGDSAGCTEVRLALLGVNDEDVAVLLFVLIDGLNEEGIVVDSYSGCD